MTALPARFRHAPFAVRDTEGSLTPGRLRRADLIAPTRGVRVSATLQDLPPPLMFAPTLSSRQHFTHTSAALLWGMPTPRSAVHVTTVGAGSVMRRRGVVGHRQTTTAVGDAPTSIVLRQRVLRLSQPRQALLECASLTREVGFDDLVAMGDWLVGSASGCDLEGLRGWAEGLDARRGVRRLRSALELVRVGAESHRETRLRLQLVKEGIRPPLLNCEVHHEGRFVGRADLVFGRERVIVEYDGDHHRVDRATYRSDMRRRERFRAAGWHAIHISDDDLVGPHWQAFVAHLRAALARGEAQSGRRSASGSAARPASSASSASVQ